MRAVLIVALVAALCVLSVSATETSCVDTPPKPTAGQAQYSCAQQKSWGKCGASWMKGYCQCSCGGSSSSNSGSHSSNGGSSPSLNALHIKTTNSQETAPVSNHGATYSEHKKRVIAALKHAKISGPQQRMLMAIAMLETSTMDPAQRDTSKTGASTNYSLFNMNQDMLSHVGGASAAMNKWSGINLVAERLHAAIGKFGVNGFLDYHRGGSTGYKDGVSYGCQDYRNAIASMVRMIDNDSSLMTDGRRIDMDVAHV